MPPEPANAAQVDLVRAQGPERAGDGAVGRLRDLCEKMGLSVTVDRSLDNLRAATPRANQEGAEIGYDGDQSERLEA